MKCKDLIGVGWARQEKMPSMQSGQLWKVPAQGRQSDRKEGSREACSGTLVSKTPLGLGRLFGEAFLACWEHTDKSRILGTASQSYTEGGSEGGEHGA